MYDICNIYVIYSTNTYYGWCGREELGIMDPRKKIKMKAPRGENVNGGKKREILS